LVDEMGEAERHSEKMPPVGVDEQREDGGGETGDTADDCFSAPMAGERHLETLGSEDAGEQ
jgi:hypothetical protein